MHSGSRVMERITLVGYKDNVKADEKTLLITGYEVTTANVHDSVILKKLMSKKEDGDQPLHADNA